jgi:predicted ATPase
LQAPLVEGLFEREAELAEIRLLLEEANSGAGRALLVEGPAGIGKTQLLQAAAGLAEAQEMHVLIARGSELERTFPFGVVYQLLEPPLASAPARERRALLAGAAAPAGALLGVGEAYDRLEPEHPADDDAAAGDPSFALMHALYWLIWNLCERNPLVLVLDDAHWADRASLRLVRFLLPRLGSLPLLLALAARTDEPGDSAPGALQRMAADPRARVMRPAPLSLSAAGELVRAALAVDAHDQFCSACHRVTGGNPFLLRELVTELRAEGIAPTAEQARHVRELAPPAVSRSVLVRLARLSDGASVLARAVAVVGDRAELRLAATLAQLDRRSAANAADELVAAGIFARGRPPSFAHPMLRAAGVLRAAGLRAGVGA